MRNILLPLAAAASALVVAAPASAQAYGNLNPAYGAPAYGAPYGNAYGYNRSGPAQWAREIQQIKVQMQHLGRQGRLTPREHRDLSRDIYSAERALWSVGRGGISFREAQAMNQRIARLHYELRRYSDWDRNRWDRGYGYNSYNGYRR